MAFLIKSILDNRKRHLKGEIMKEKIIDKSKILGIILVLTFLISIPYLNFEPIGTHDISYHTNRIISTCEELKAGHFPVLIHSNLLDGFGYAGPLFYPELFLYIPAILTAFGLNFLTSYKIFTMLTTFFTLLFTFYSANHIFKNRNTSWTVTILYGASFYRLADLYERGAIGEVLAFVFLPIILCGLYEIIFGENKKWWIICLGIFGIVNSHVLTLAMTIILILVICILNIVRLFKEEKRIVFLIIAGVISILLTLSFVMPYLEQSSSDCFNVDKKIYSGEFLQNGAVSLKELINNSFDTKNFYKGIGIILLILPMFIVTVKNKDCQTIFMKQLFGIGLLVLLTSTSIFPWEQLCNKFDFITILQFPFRLNIISTLLFSFVGGYALCNIIENKTELNKLVYILLILFTLNLLSTLNTNPNNNTEEMIITSAPVGNGEYKPYALKQEDTKVHNIAYGDEIEFTRTSSKMEFEYTNKEDEMIIHIPLAYYKGYVAYIEEENGNVTNLTVEEEPHTKNVIVKNDKILNGKITIEYKMTIMQKLGYTIATITLIGLVVYIINDKFKIIKKK